MINDVLKFNDEEFDKMCLINKDGHCKYWNVEAFGYSENDKEAPLDKFFPEKIKSYLRASQFRVIKEIVETIEEKKVLPYDNHVGNDTEKAYDMGKSNGFNQALTNIISLLTKEIKE